jgi:predicted PhzF superfamily epimerase YddE/YHI9
MTSQPYYTYDAFASSKRFSGNPACVIPLQDESMPDDLMQLVAK